MHSRKEDILTAALELYNKHGLEQVTMRDIAKKINISSGNLTYHFPTRNDIVLALMQQLLVSIDEALNAPVQPVHKSMLAATFYQCRVIIKKQLEYEFLFNKRYSEIITDLPEMQALLQQVLKKRFDQWKLVNDQLVKEGSALPSLKKESHAHSHLLNIVGLYWHQEVAIYFPKLNAKEKTEHALALIFQLYKPYLTKKGLAELAQVTKKLEHY